MADTHPNVDYSYDSAWTLTPRGDVVKVGSATHDIGDGLNETDNTVNPTFILDSTDEATMITFWRSHANEVFEWQPDWETSTQLYRFVSATVAYSNHNKNYWTATYIKRHA